MKANCYECQHRGTVPGDAHSRCCYPGLKSLLSDMLSSDNTLIMRKLNVQGDPHGIKSGWFFWPYNFDPVWLENCDGFTSKEEV